MNEQTNHIGKVILAGAGPGDPELLTIKTLRYLQRADVVIVDRLVSPDILRYYTRQEALIIPVGKQNHQTGSTPQTDINTLLVEHAYQGRLVVRLKGGDVSIFSNVLDELQTLVRHRIPYEIVPGITAALGAAAYAGIPLTAREHATAVRFLTGYRPDTVQWEELAQTTDTLVFYMSSEPLDTLVARLIQHGIAEDRWIAIIEQATTPMQRVTAYPVHDYPAAAAGSTYASPTLVIIGKVAALHADFHWLPDSSAEALYFPPVPSVAAQPFDQPKSKVIC